MTHYVAPLVASFFYINAPCVDMREEPSSSSKLVSQTFFSEAITPNFQKTDGSWIRIKTDVDGYEGWIEKKFIYERDARYPASSTTAKVKRASAHLYHVNDTEYGPKLTLPFESRLEVLGNVAEDTKDRWIEVALPDGNHFFVQSGQLEIDPKLKTLEEICGLATKEGMFLGKEYIWGGRSGFGYDCSGFVQMLYRQMGVYLPRDSKDQMKWKGFYPVTVKNLKAGDLVFFGLDKDKIRHVGFCLGNGKFIHSTVAENAPRIRISSLEDHEWNGSGRLKYVAGRRYLEASDKEEKKS